MNERKLADTPPETWGNTILHRLAFAIGEYPVDGNGTITADPDEVLENALEIIWRYQDMADS